MPIHNLRGAQTPHICMAWTWDAVCKVLQPQSKRSGMVFSGGIGVSMKPYAHPQPEKALKYIIYICHGHGMQFKRFYSLIVAWFAHLHKVRFQPILTNLGKCLWRY
jgi:hypothetical protein